MNAIQLLRCGEFPAKKPEVDHGSNKIILLDMRTKEEYLHSHIKNSLSFPSPNV
jgi:rhodanese-related sulfurtransferase